MADNTYSKMLESLTRLIAAEQNLDMAILNPPADLAVAAFRDCRHPRRLCIRRSDAFRLPR